MEHISIGKDIDPWGSAIIKNNFGITTIINPNLTDIETIIKKSSFQESSDYLINSPEEHYLPKENIKNMNLKICNKEENYVMNSIVKTFLEVLQEKLLIYL